MTSLSVCTWIRHCDIYVSIRCLESAELIAVAADVEHVSPVCREAGRDAVDALAGSVGSVLAGVRPDLAWTVRTGAGRRLTRIRKL